MYYYEQESLNFDMKQSTRQGTQRYIPYFRILE